MTKSASAFTSREADEVLGMAESARATIRTLRSRLARATAGADRVRRQSWLNDRHRDERQALRNRQSDERWEVGERHRDALAELDRDTDPDGEKARALKLAAYTSRMALAAAHGAERLDLARRHKAARLALAKGDRASWRAVRCSGSPR